MSEMETQQQAEAQPGVDIPVEFFLQQLRNEIANLNDQRIRLQAQVDYQAAVIAQFQNMTQQPEEHTHD